MSFAGFDSEDFDVFEIPGLEARMKAIISRVRPKLQQIGEISAPFLSVQCGEEMFAHVAKHARRTVHPPNDTWVAWSHNKKGYKAHPHFQVGLWGTHLFIQFAIIYESHQKSNFAAQLGLHYEEIKRAIPGEYVWSMDHTKPDGAAHRELTDNEFAQMIFKLKHIKKAELLCGIHLHRDNPIVADGSRLLETIERTFATVMPLYRLAR